MIDIDELLYAIRHPTEEEQRRSRHTFSQIIKSAKPNRCINCGKEETLCKSHFVPRSVLKNITVNGEVNSFFALIEGIGLPEKYGLNNAGTFQAICRKCDGELFRDYETPEKLLNFPTQEMLAQIAMKNYIRFVHKRRVDFMGGRSVLKSGTASPNMYYYFQNKLADIKRYEKCFLNAKRRSQGKSESRYHVVYFNRLPYVVPLAFQAALTVIYDFDGNIINNIESDDSRYKFWELHVCVFPLNDSSVVLLFIDEKAKRRYENFIRTFETFSDNDKLSLIAYLILLYSEDMFFHPPIIDVINKSEILMNAAEAGMNDIILETRERELYRGASAQSIFSPEREDAHNLWLFKDAPNLLGYECRVKI